MADTALVLIDLQRDFFDESGPVGSLEKAIALPATRKLLRNARRNQWAIVHVITKHRGVETLPTHLRKLGLPPYCVEGTPGAEIIAGLAKETDILIEKSGYSGFSGTALDRALRGIRSVVLVGIAADCCVLSTALDASASFHKDVFLPYEAISASTLRAYVFGLEAAAKSAGGVVDTQHLLRNPEPEWDQRIDPDRLPTVAEAWFRPHLKAIANLKATNQDLQELTVEATLDLVEDTLGDAFP